MQEIIVKVTLAEILIAATWGSYRNVQSWKIAKDKHGAETEKDGWQINIMACISELAWAKHKNIYYNAGIGNYTLADIADFYQIRSSSITYKANACLRIHKTDKKDLPYILALVGMSEVLFVGWLWGHEGQKDKYWGDKWDVNRPAYFIEQKDLNPMTSIPSPEDME